MPPILWNVSRPLRALTDVYLNVTGLSQRWNMFWNPPTVDQYMGIRYYVGRAGDRPSSVATEVIFPAHREDQVRLFASYGNSFFDKAIAIAADDFSSHLDKKLIRPDTNTTDAPTDLAPIVRYFAKRFRETRLLPPERLFRIEVWWGTAPIPPRRQRLTPEMRRARLAALRRYYAGPQEEQWTGSTYLPLRASIGEAGITWVLQYFEQW